jgi:predicted O-linked N-acetylglucosamine transferase (SPINDLY family)
MDWRISDPYLDPPGTDDDFYVEKTIRLPETFWCYDPLTDESAVNALPSRQGQPFTFGCLNNFCKVNDVTLDLWGRVLKAVPGARLIILSDPGAHRDRTLAKLQATGIEDASRIEFVSRRSRLDYLRLYHRIDVALDTFPCNGHTTSLDALWMGVPMVSLVGKMAMARGGLSVATNLGLPQLAVNSAEEYARTAVEFASDLPKLAEIRATLRERMRASPLMDGPRFARNMEAAYRQLWRAWCGA